MSKEAISKVKKLLALSKSSNPNEAALALERARELMDKYEISSSDLAYSDINTKEGAGFKAKTPALHFTALANLIAQLFGCEMYFNVVESQKWKHNKGYKSTYTTKPVFVGFSPNEELASYCFDNLYRKLKKARAEYKTGKRLRSSILRARDSYALGWVYGVRRSILHIIPENRDVEILGEDGLMVVNPLAAYVKEKATGEMKGRSMDEDDRAGNRGYLDGKEVKINKGVSGSATNQKSLL